jgi:glycosyltransferase involved in cell wall biosynthesis
VKRCLIIYHSFDDWEMGPIRLRRIARHLERHHFQPVVLTSPANSRSVAGLPPGLEILRADALDLAEVYRRLRGRAPRPDSPRRADQRAIGLTSAINRWCLVPDKQVTWVRPAVRLARAYLRRHPVDVLFASLAPRSNLLVAARLARDLGLPCVLEYRDLWTGSPYHHLAQPTRLHDALHAHLERSALAAATRVTAVSRGIADYLQQQYGHALRAPVALQHGFFDPAEYPAVPPRAAGGPFVISYVGAFYATRQPTAFFEGLRMFVDRRQLAPERLRFRWAGSVMGGPDFERMLERLALAPYVDRIGQVAHGEALRLLCESDASLLIQAPDDTIHIPGKLFEALGARVPLLALSPPCETTELIERMRAGRTCPHDPAAVADALEQLWTWRQSGTPWPYDEDARGGFAADAALERLTNLFEEAISACPRPS